MCMCVSVCVCVDVCVCIRVCAFSVIFRFINAALNIISMRFHLTTMQLK